MSALSTVAKATHVAESHVGVHRVEKLLMRKMGLYYVADMHLEVEPTMTVFRGHEISHEVKEAVRAAFPQIVELTIHVTVRPRYPMIVRIIAACCSSSIPAP